MSRIGRPKTELILTDEEREQLLRWSRWPTSAQALALRSRIILGCAEGLDNSSVAAQVGCSTNTVSKWRARFLASQLDGLVLTPTENRASIAD
ncbi:helix-turn-helix domain-containing protein [Cryobacterium flavum]|uniref:Helix-turn-helix domain-containing protein n=1 Tax=Cryobacterium flavum TaxID=1424659 RepID=A0ABY2I1T3_9MICO|nr:helix-turn-helix domain-containing protein [Cryobacterium flavum]